MFRKHSISNHSFCSVDTTDILQIPQIFDQNVTRKLHHWGNLNDLRNNIFFLENKLKFCDFMLSLFHINEPYCIDKGQHSFADDWGYTYETELRLSWCLFEKVVRSGKRSLGAENSSWSSGRHTNVMMVEWLGLSVFWLWEL